MMIIGVDYHPSDPYIAFVDRETGECGKRRLNHSEGEAEKFYRELAARGVSVRVGMEATGYSRWFERLLAELGIELWIGDAAEIETEGVGYSTELHGAPYPFISSRIFVTSFSSVSLRRRSQAAPNHSTGCMSTHTTSNAIQSLG
jgi:hypothetical protein